MQEEGKQKCVEWDLMVLGLVVLAMGLPALASGIHGYFWLIPQEEEDINEAAEEMGVTEIPGLSLEFESRFYATVGIIGALMVAAGAIMMALSSRDRRSARKTGRLHLCGTGARRMK